MFFQNHITYDIKIIEASFISMNQQNSCNLFNYFPNSARWTVRCFLYRDVWMYNIPMIAMEELTTNSYTYLYMDFSLSGYCYTDLSIRITGNRKNLSVLSQKISFPGIARSSFSCWWRKNRLLCMVFVSPRVGFSFLIQIKDMEEHQIFFSSKIELEVPCGFFW